MDDELSSYMIQLQAMQPDEAALSLLACAISTTATRDRADSAAFLDELVKLLAAYRRTL